MEIDLRLANLYRELTNLDNCCRELTNAEYVIESKRKTRHPNPTAEDYQKAWGDDVPNGNGWPNILWHWRDTLVRFWFAYYRSHAALDALPEEWVDDAAKPRIDRWTAKLRKLLNWLGDANGATHPTTPWQHGKVHLPTFPRHLLPDDWSLRSRELVTFADDVRAIHNTKPIAAKNTAARAPGGRPINPNLAKAYELWKSKPEIGAGGAAKQINKREGDPAKHINGNDVRAYKARINGRTKPKAAKKRKKKTTGN